MRKNIFEKFEKFFMKAGTFLFFHFVLYMESKKQNKKIKEENILKKRKSEFRKPLPKIKNAEEDRQYTKEITERT